MKSSFKSINNLVTWGEKYPSYLGESDNEKIKQHWEKKYIGLCATAIVFSIAIFACVTDFFLFFFLAYMGKARGSSTNTSVTD